MDAPSKELLRAMLNDLNYTMGYLDAKECSTPMRGLRIIYGMLSQLETGEKEEKNEK
jgi:hypothetical protein